MTFENKQEMLRLAFGNLSPRQRETAMNFLVGFVCVHVPLDKWKEALQSSAEAGMKLSGPVRYDNDLGGEKTTQGAPTAVDAARTVGASRLHSGKDAAAGPDD